MGVGLDVDVVVGSDFLNHRRAPHADDPFHVDVVKEPRPTGHALTDAHRSPLRNVSSGRIVKDRGRSVVERSHEPRFEGAAAPLRRLAPTPRLVLLDGEA